MLIQRIDFGDKALEFQVFIFYCCGRFLNVPSIFLLLPRKTQLYLLSVFRQSSTRFQQSSQTNLIVSHDSLRSTVTNQESFDQQNLYSVPDQNAFIWQGLNHTFLESECERKRCCPAFGFQFGDLRYHH